MAGAGQADDHAGAGVCLAGSRRTLDGEQAVVQVAGDGEGRGDRVTALVKGQRAAALRARWLAQQQVSSGP